MSLHELTAVQLRDRMQQGDVSSREVCQAFLDRIANADSHIGAFLRVDPKSVIAQADAIDRRRQSGQTIGPLAGLPVAVKDLLCTEGETTTCASRMLEHFVPPYDATAIARLKQADGVLLGKTNLDEFAMGGSTESSAYQLTRNPWNLECVPGGSSGGAAACVAASMAPLSVGTDTGGSIRQPASYCGVVGLKPTYGRVSRFGLVAFASSLDQIGPMAHTAEDTALLLEALAGHDPRDSTSVNVPVPEYSASVKQPIAGLRLGIVRDHLGEGVGDDVRNAIETAIDVYRSLGAEIVDVELPHCQYGIATYYIIAPCEASSNLARYDSAHYGYRTDEKAMLAELEKERVAVDGDEVALERIDSTLVRMYRKSRSEGFGDEVKRRIMLGTYALSAGYYDAYYLKALKVRRLIRQDYDAAFAHVDCIIGPVTPTPAFRIGENDDNPLAMYLVDLFTVTANLAGIPGISIPCGMSSTNMPIGLQLQGHAFAEETLLRAAHMFQEATDWHTHRP
ncbi:MAG: Asp-tRNA(Asn)/Glu-tRNA(Gln) amidotransferase subunit GatA [Planctomycetales bacterium]|nr:Asp-tRNA(Asn)/Glu-tRNA(Gln) amidotransferase subunit GatA [Planctomycetales bacterium]